MMGGRRGLCLPMSGCYEPGVTHVTSPGIDLFHPGYVTTWRVTTIVTLCITDNNPSSQSDHSRYPEDVFVCWLSYWSGNYNNTQHFAETWGPMIDKDIGLSVPRHLVWIIEDRGFQWHTPGVTHGLLLITRHDVIVTLAESNIENYYYFARRTGCQQ